MKSKEIKKSKKDKKLKRDNKMIISLFKAN